jgi:hypothetical protein
MALGLPCLRIHGRPRAMSGMDAQGGLTGNEMVGLMKHDW